MREKNIQKWSPERSREIQGHYHHKRTPKIDPGSKKHCVYKQLDFKAPPNTVLASKSAAGSSKTQYLQAQLVRGIGLALTQQKT